MHSFLRFFAAGVVTLAGTYSNAESLGGYPDLSLNGFGYGIGPFRGENERLSSSAENDEGMMVAVGTFGTSDTQCAVVRHRNSAFNGGTTLALDAVTNESCSKVLALGNGEFRIIGTAMESTGRFTGFIAALNTDGRLNTGFHQQGMRSINAIIPWLASTERTVLTSGMIDAQGRLLAVGRVIDAATNTTRGLILRFLTDGALDTSFGTEGSLPLADFNPPIVITTSVATDSSGRVYVMGFTQNPGFPDVGVIFRLQEDGQTDLSFGAGMNAVARNGGGGRGFFNQCSRVASLSIDAQQRMVLGCEPDVSGAIPGPILAPGVLRLQADGQPDPSFGGGDGYVELLPWNSPIGGILLPRVALRANGQIVAGASLYRASTNVDPQDIYVTRLNVDGSTDFGFGANGNHQSNYTVDLWQTTDFKNEQLNELRLDARERVVLSGSYVSQSGSSNPSYGLIARLGMADPEKNAGFLDPDFSYQGFRVERINDVSGTRRNTVASNLTIDTQNRSVLIGTLYLETAPVSSVCGISRYLPDGRLDNSFSGNGQRAISLIPGGTTYCDSVVALPSGELMVAGFYPLPVSHNTATLVRLLDDGTLDTQFWGDGVLDTWNDLGFSARQISAIFTDMTIDPQGRILLLASGRAVGTQDPNFSCGFGALNDECGLVIRLQSDGSLDTTFGNNGIRLLISPTNPSRMYPSAIAVDRNDRILIVGDEGSGAADYSAVLFDSASDGLTSQYLRLRDNTPCRAATSLSIDASNGRIVGCAQQNSASVLRLLPNNNIDLNFGLGGLAAVDYYTTAGGDTGSVTTIIPQSDNALIVVGTHRQPTVWAPNFGSYDTGVMKLDRFGQNLGFGAAYGDLFRFPTYPGAYDEFPAAAAMQADGRIVIAGTKSDQRPGVPQQDNTEMFVMRIGNPQPLPLADAIFQNGFE